MWPVQLSVMNTGLSASAFSWFSGTGGIASSRVSPASVETGTSS